jgi:hypothetical protein
MLRLAHRVLRRTSSRTAPLRLDFHRGVIVPLARGVRWCSPRLILVVAVSCVMADCSRVHAQLSGVQGAIVGRVSTNTGQRVAGATVSLTTTAGHPVAQTKTGGGGAFEFTKVSPGTYRLGVAAPEGSDLVGDDKLLYESGEPSGTVVRVPSGRVVRVDRRLEKGGRVEVLLLRGGQPWFADCPCEVSLSRGQSLFLGSVGIASDRFFFSGLPSADDYSVALEADGYATRRTSPVVVRVGEIARVSFEYDPADATGVEGTLRASGGSPLRDVVIFARRQGDDSQNRYAGRSRTDAAGNFKIVGLPPGVYYLDAMTAAKLARATVVSGTIATISITWGQQADLQDRTLPVLAARSMRVVRTAVPRTSTSSISNGPAPPSAEGVEIRDAAVERLLSPERGTSRATLVRLTNGDVQYRVQFDDAVPTEYLKQYGELIRKRGVHLSPETSSPHAQHGQSSGWTFLMLDRGRQTPFTLRWTRFRREVGPQGIDRFSSTPLTVEGKSLVVDLGVREGEWQEAVVVPTADALEVPELPFSRFPDARLKWQSPASSGTGNETGRFYVVQGASKADVLRHHENALRNLGITELKVSDDRLDWSGAPIRGLMRISLSLEPSVAMIGGPNMGLENLAKEWPHLLEGAPEFLEYRVMVWFTTAEVAQRYRTEVR